MIILILLVIVTLFAFVVFFGAPYVPTLKPQVETAFELLDLKKGQTMIELGSGDGRVALAAAKRGLNVVGYEINPLLVILSIILTWRYRKQVKIVWGNFWRADWPQSDGAFVFLLDRYMKKLDKKIKNSKNSPSRIVSFAFKIPGKKPLKYENGVYLYEYKT